MLIQYKNMLLHAKSLKQKNELNVPQTQWKYALENKESFISCNNHVNNIVFKIMND